MITACGFAVLCFRIAETFHIFAAYYFQDMNLTDAIPLRHSVRSYTEKPVETEKLAILEKEMEKYNARNGICMKLVKEAGGIIGCPADAVSSVIEISSFVSSKNGGDGAVRDFIEHLIESK